MSAVSPGEVNVDDQGIVSMFGRGNVSVVASGVMSVIGPGVVFDEEGEGTGGITMKTETYTSQSTRTTQGLELAVAADITL